MVWMEVLLGSRSLASRDSLIKVLEPTDMFLAYPDMPPEVNRVPRETSHAASTSCSPSSVLTVFLPSDIPQIGKTVVLAITVYVVNLVGDFPRLVIPRDPMRREIATK